MSTTVESLNQIQVEIFPIMGTFLYPYRQLCPPDNNYMASEWNWAVPLNARDVTVIIL